MLGKFISFYNFFLSEPNRKTLSINCYGIETKGLAGRVRMIFFYVSDL